MQIISHVATRLCRLPISTSCITLQQSWLSQRGLTYFRIYRETWRILRRNQFLNALGYSIIGVGIFHVYRKLWLTLHKLALTEHYPPHGPQNHEEAMPFITQVNLRCYFTWAKSEWLLDERWHNGETLIPQIRVSSNHYFCQWPYGGYIFYFPGADHNACTKFVSLQCLAQHLPGNWWQDYQWS